MTIGQTVQLQGALDAVAHGWAVFPFAPDGRTPALKGYLDRATTNPDDVRRAWGPNGAYWGRNIGIACGLSRLVVLDLDDPRAHGTHLPVDWQQIPGVVDGRDVLAVLCERHRQPWPDTRIHTSPSGGWHMVFTTPAGVKIGPSNSRVAPCIDIKAGRSSVHAPGSARHDGNYQVLVDTDPAPLPRWLLDLPGFLPPRPRPAPAHVPPLGQGNGKARLRGLLAWLLESEPGQRNQRLHWAACRTAELIAVDELDDATAAEVLEQAAAAIGLAPLEARGTIRSGLRGTPGGVAA